MKYTKKSDDLQQICKIYPHCRRGGACPARAVQRRTFGCTHADTHAPVGADDPVRPAVRVRKIGRTDANPHHICRGRCRALPARRTSVFYEPSRQICRCPNGRTEASAPTRRCARSPFIMQFCGCALHGRVCESPRLPPGGKLSPKVTDEGKGSYF